MPENSVTWLVSQQSARLKASALLNVPYMYVTELVSQASSELKAWAP